MRTLAEVQKDITNCDEEIIRLLTRRMERVGELVACRKAQGEAIIAAKEERLKNEEIRTLLADNPYKEELSEVFLGIGRAAKVARTKALFRHNIALIGFMGTGKSTVSHYLRDALAMEEKETDAMIVESEGMPITEIFERYGESYFRNRESETVLKLQDVHRAIISCGGGLVMRDENIANLKKSSRIVLLTATPETILERVKNSRERPILNGHMNVEYIKELMEKRRVQYEKAADVIIATDGKNVAEICEELVYRLSE